jgi:hypothetical protein
MLFNSSCLKPELGGVGAAYQHAKGTCPSCDSVNRSAAPWNVRAAKAVEEYGKIGRVNVRVTVQVLG